MTEHHYASLLKCGHFKELGPSWNTVIDTGLPSTPIEAYCVECDTLSAIMKFARVDNPKTGDADAQAVEE
jgi:hypothetical protein